MVKTVLITGASRGIGFSIAKALAPHTEHLILIAKHKESLDKAVAQLKGIKVIPIVTDLEDTAQISKLIEQIQKKFDSLDILVNNAGIYIGKQFENTSLEEINKLINLNFRSYSLLTHQILPLLKKGTHPQIINISSCASGAQIYGEALYSATKAAVTAFSNVIRKELNEKGIRVTTIQPWGVDTYDVPQPEYLLNPDEIGELVSFVVNRPPAVQIDLVELSNIKQWRGKKPPWIE